MKTAPADEISLYNTGNIVGSLASRVSCGVRQRMFELFLKSMQPTSDSTILDVGVTSDQVQEESNYFERLYPHKNKLTCCGIADASHLEKKYPGLKFVLNNAGKPLPFADKQFDIAFSNAVIEHVGNSEQQHFFAKEIARVAKAFFVTTPNRWFPVELHTQIPLLHYLPAPMYRRILRSTRYSYWAEEENLNLLDAGKLSAMFPKNALIKRVRLMGFTSNLVACSLPPTSGSKA